MLTVLGLSERPCFICGEKDGAAEVRFKDGTFAGVLCMRHAWERLTPAREKAPAGPGKAGDGKEVRGAPGG
jgi:hypothetical protein